MIRQTTAQKVLSLGAAVFLWNRYETGKSGVSCILQGCFDVIERSEDGGKCQAKLEAKERVGISTKDGNTVERVWIAFLGGESVVYGKATEIAAVLRELD